MKLEFEFGIDHRAKTAHPPLLCRNGWSVYAQDGYGTQAEPGISVELTVLDSCQLRHEHPDLAVIPWTPVGAFAHIVAWAKEQPSGSVWDDARSTDFVALIERFIAEQADDGDTCEARR